MGAFGKFSKPFGLPLDQQGLVLVEGSNQDGGDSTDSNGAGKSLMFEAIPWCFWKKMSRYGERRLGEADACHPKLGADVLVEFETRGGLFQVHRTEKVPKLGASLSVRGWSGGEWKPLEGVSAEKVRASGELSSLLGFDYCTLRSALFLQASGFGFARGTYKDQSGILESVLQFDLLSEAGVVANERSKEIGSSISILSHKQVLLQEQIQAGEERLGEFSGLDERRAEIGDLDAQIEATLDGLKILSGLEKKKSDLSVRLQNLQSFANQATRRCTEFQRDLQSLDSVLSLSGKSCPTCRQALGAAHIKGIQKDAEKIRKSLVVSQAESNDCLGKLDMLEDELSQVQDRLAKLKSDQERVELLKSNRDSLQKAFDQQESMRRAEEGRLKKARAELAGLKEETAGLWKEKARAEFWEKSFKEGLKAQVLSASSPVLNQAAQYYADLLSGGTINVEFNPLRESRSQDVIRLSGPVAPTYEGLSSGERRKVDLIVAKSLNAVARWRMPEPLNLSLMDEVFDALDESGLQQVIQMIHKDLEQIWTIFVITHRPDLRSILSPNKVITVRRSGGWSEVLQ